MVCTNLSMSSLRIGRMPGSTYSGLVQDAPDAGGAGGDDVAVEHHEGQSAVPWRAFIVHLEIRETMKENAVEAFRAWIAVSSFLGMARYGWVM